MVVLLLGYCWLGATASTAHAQPQSSVEQPRRVYVPVEDLDVVLSRDQRGVLLPRDEFETLFDQARKNAADRPRQPADVLIHSARYTARPAGDMLLISATLQFTQFTEGWVSIPLPAENLSVEQARIGDDTARLGRFPAAGQKGPGALVLLHNQAGAATLELELSTPLTAAGSDKLATFGLIPAPSAMFEIELPAGKHLLVDGLSLERPNAADAQTTYSFPVGGRADLSLRLTDRADDLSADALLLVTTAYGLHVTPGEVTWRAQSALQVFGQKLDRLVFTVPRSLEISSVESTGLEGWELTDDPDDAERTAVTLNYRQPFDGSQSVTLSGVMSTEPGAGWNVPSLMLRNATSHVGRIVLQHPAGVRVRTVSAEGVREAVPVPRDEKQPAESAAVSSTSTQLFDVWREDFSLSLITQTRERELHAALSTVLHAGENGLTLSSSAMVTTLFAPLFELDIALPAEWAIDSVTVDGQPVQWTSLPQEAGTHRVRVPFSPPLAVGASKTVVLQARRDPEGWPPEAEPVLLDLPEVRMPQLNVVEGIYVVKGDDDLEIVPEELTGLDPAMTGVEGERLGYRYQDTVFSGSLRIERKPAQLSARTLAFSRIDRRTVFTHLESQLTITGGGSRAVQCVLPQATGEDLRFQLVDYPARIIEQQSLALDDGTRLWTLMFDRRIHAVATITVQVTQPRPEEDEITLPTLQIRGADRENGFVAIEAAGDQMLRITAVDATGNPLAEVDPADLAVPHYAPQERIVGAYRYNRPGYRVTVSVDRFDRVAVPTAICHHLQITSALGRTGEFQHEASFRFTAVGVQSLLVALPTESGYGRGNLWAVLIDGRPIEVRTRSDGYLIPLASVNVSQGPRLLKLFYRTQVHPLSSLGRVQERPPHLAVINGSDVQPVEILEQEWKLYYPDETLLTASSGEFAPLKPLDYRSVLAGLRDGFSKLSKDRWMSAGVVAGVTVLCLLVLVMIYRRVAHYVRSRTVKAAITIGLSCAILGMCLWAMILPATQSAREFSRRVSTLSETSDEAATAEVQMETSSPASEPTAAPAIPQTLAPSDAPNAPPPSRAADPFGRESGERAGMIAGEKVPQAADETLGFSRQMGLAGEAMGVPMLGTAENSERGSVLAQEGLMFDYDGLVDGGRPTSGVQPGGGLLSLSLNIARPADSDEKSFRYAGTRTAATGVGLDVVYEDRTAGDLRCWLTAVIVAGLMWVCRNSRVGIRASWAALGITLPIGLSPVVPPAAAIFLDGIFLGTIAGIALWTFRAVLHALAAALARRPSAAQSTAAVLILAALMSGGAPARADEPAVKPAEKAIIQPAEPSIVIPYDAGTDPLKASRVLLPHDQFLKLWNLAHPDQQVHPDAPASAVVAEARYDIQLESAGEGESRQALVRARLVVSNLRDGQATVALPFGKVALDSATLDGAAAPLISSPTNAMAPYSVVVKDSGAHVLDVVFRIPAQVTGPAGRWMLPLRPVAAGVLAFTLPENDLVVRINGSETAYRRTQVDGQDVIELPIDNGTDVGLSWQPRTTMADVDRIVHADSTTAARVSDAGFRITTRLTLSVPQGNLSEMTFALPESLRLQQIAGPDVGGWEMDGMGRERSLKVFFRRTVGDKTELQFELFLDVDLTAPSASLTLPIVAPRNVTRDTGRIGVYADDQLSVRSGQTSGLIQINAAEFQPDAALGISGQPQFAYRFVARPFELPITVTRRTPQTTASAMHFVNVERRKLRMSGRVDVQISEAPRSTLVFQLPEDFLPLEISASYLNDWTVVAQENGARLLVIEFDVPRMGAVQVGYQGTIPRDPAATKASIDLPQVLDVSRLVTQSGIAIDPVYTATLSAFEGWRSVDPNTLPGELKTSSAPIRFGFISSETAPGPVELGLSRAVPELEGRVATVITVAETLVNYTLALDWQVTQAAADTFTFTTPDWLAGKLKFDRTGIRQITEVTGDDARTTWTITLHEPRSERLFLLGTADLPPAADQVQAPDVRFLQNGNALATQQQFVLLINHSYGQLQLTNPDTVASVTAEALLPITINQTLVDQAAEIVQVRRAGELPAWQFRRFVEQRAAAASVNVAFLATTIAHDGTWRTAASYQVRNRSRQFLALVLPEDSRMLSVFVADRPARPVETAIGEQRVHLLALPKTSEADLSFAVTCVIEGRLPEGALPRGFRPTGREFDLPAPLVLGQQQSPEFGIPVARTEWKVYLPEDVHAVPVDDSSRTNLSRTTEDSAAAAYALNLLQESANLFNVLESAKSQSQRFRAASNLKQIEQAVKATEQQEVSKLSDRRQLAELQKELNSAYLKSDFGTVLLEMDANSSQNVNGTVEGAQPQTRGTRVYSLDDALVKGAIVSNNSIIIADNNGDGINLPQATDDSAAVPKFNVEHFYQDFSKAQAGKPSTSDRESLRRLNMDQLQTLNEQVDAKDKLWTDLGMARGERMVEQRAAGGSGALGGGFQNRFNMPFGGQAQSGVADSDPARGYAYATTHDGAVEFAAPAGAGDGWTQVGGLSLRIEVPRNAQQLDFSKIGGSPKLALAIRPSRTAEIGLGLIWTAVWLVIGLGIALAFIRGASANAVAHGLVLPLILLGLLGLLVAPWPLNVPAALLFIAGACIWAWQHRDVRSA